MSPVTSSRVPADVVVNTHQTPSGGRRYQAGHLRREACGHGSAPIRSAVDGGTALPNEMVLLQIDSARLGDGACGRPGCRSARRVGHRAQECLDEALPGVAVWRVLTCAALDEEAEVQGLHEVFQ